MAVPLPLRSPFIYSAPKDGTPVLPGMRVLVPFGARRITGYVIGLAQAADAEGFRVRPIARVLDTVPSLDAPLLEFLRRAAEYYMHPLGEVLRAALPPGINPFEKAGQFHEARIQPKFETVFTARPLPEAAAQEMQRRAKTRWAVYAHIAAHPGISAAALRSRWSTCAAHLRRLTDDGWLDAQQQPVVGDLFAGLDIAPDTPPTLTDEQAAATDAIVAQIRTGQYGGFLLHGVTGSGKTEVYLRAIAAAREMGRGALVLVPEITLTPQLVRRYMARFGTELAVWHSGLSDRARYDAWQRLRSGEVKMVIGVRSAVFAPLDNPGVIIVDEEHDTSFKQETGFAYHARDLAVLRASMSQSAVILGSATPSLESRHNADAGKLRRLALVTRATQRPLPHIEIVDLTQHRSGPGGQTLLSAPLHRAISETLSRQEQVILFLNRRGFAPTLLCRDCGEGVRCAHCAVSLTYHTHPRGLVCHYCDHRQSVPERCPACAGTALHPVGIGTQKAEEILRELFPAARIARLDRDVGSGARAEAILDALRREEVDILVGTQMVTKGHDFPKVTLVGVLQGDVGLHMPDFRAGEKTFQLLTQVAGRAGRSTHPGRAIIQTFNPQHPAIAAAQHHDYARFAAQELVDRAELGYPPFGKMVAIRFNSTDADAVEAAAKGLAQHLRNAAKATGTDVTLLGPTPSPLSLLQGRHRWHLLLKSPRQDWNRRLLLAVVEAIEAPPKGVRIHVDIDPFSML